jgi:hypothetical protein
MGRPPDIREFLSSWPYDPDNNITLEIGKDGREIILVRQPLGLKQYEVRGRPTVPMIARSCLKRWERVLNRK